MYIYLYVYVNIYIYIYIKKSFINFPIFESSSPIKNNQRRLPRRQLRAEFLLLLLRVCGRQHLGSCANIQIVASGSCWELPSVNGRTIGKWWLNGGLMGFYGIYPLVMTDIAVENGHVEWNKPLEMAILHSFVKSPEG